MNTNPSKIVLGMKFDLIVEEVVLGTVCKNAEINFYNPLVNAALGFLA